MLATNRTCDGIFRHNHLYEGLRRRMAVKYRSMTCTLIGRLITIPAFSAPITSDRGWSYRHDESQTSREAIQKTSASFESGVSHKASIVTHWDTRLVVTTRRRDTSTKRFRLHSIESDC